MILELLKPISICEKSQQTNKQKAYLHYTVSNCVLTALGWQDNAQGVLRMSKHYGLGKRVEKWLPRKRLMQQIWRLINEGLGLVKNAHSRERELCEMRSDPNAWPPLRNWLWLLVRSYLHSWHWGKSICQADQSMADTQWLSFSWKFIGICIIINSSSKCEVYRKNTGLIGWLIALMIRFASYKRLIYKSTWLWHHKHITMLHLIYINANVLFSQPAVMDYKTSKTSTM